ncbi:MAG TPA: peptidase, partial [Syntrophorhabdus aromaticivorans]|nr:peptidase [Syntrophorhabdus aromaticivorans]
MVINAASQNVPPNADAGPSRNALAGSAVELSGGRSSDPDNGPQPLGFRWSFATRPAGSALSDNDIIGNNTNSARFVPDIAGVYELRLTANDGESSSSTVVQVTASPSNVAPNAGAGDDVTVTPGRNVVLVGSASNDPDQGPQPLTYAWRFVSIPAGSTLGNGDIASA